MARTVIERVTDDFDGTEGATTVRIGWQGEWREIDLGDKNMAALSKAFDRYWDAARRVRAEAPGRGARTRRGASTTQGHDPKVIRAWALENGVAVPLRGRIPGSVVEQYIRAGG